MRLRLIAFVLLSVAAVFVGLAVLSALVAFRGERLSAGDLVASAYILATFTLPAVWVASLCGARLSRTAAGRVRTGTVVGALVGATASVVLWAWVLDGSVNVFVKSVLYSTGWWPLLMAWSAALTWSVGAMATGVVPTNGKESDGRRSGP
jgi:hypothetical protein